MLKIVLRQALDVCEAKASLRERIPQGWGTGPGQVLPGIVGEFVDILSRKYLSRPPVYIADVRRAIAGRLNWTMDIGGGLQWTQNYGVRRPAHGQSITLAQNSAHHTSTGCMSRRGP